MLRKKGPIPDEGIGQATCYTMTSFDEQRINSILSREALKKQKQETAKS